MRGVGRITLYDLWCTGRASEELCAVLTPLVRDFEAGKLRFKRSGPRDTGGAESLGDRRKVGAGAGPQVKLGGCHSQASIKLQAGFTLLVRYFCPISP
jgi:hypothetical protein